MKKSMLCCVSLRVIIFLSISFVCAKPYDEKNVDDPPSAPSPPFESLPPTISPTKTPTISPTKTPSISPTAVNTDNDTDNDTDNHTNTSTGENTDTTSSNCIVDSQGAYTITPILAEEMIEIPLEYKYELEYEDGFDPINLLEGIGFATVNDLIQSASDDCIEEIDDPGRRNRLLHKHDRDLRRKRIKGRKRLTGFNSKPADRMLLANQFKCKSSKMKNCVVVQGGMTAYARKEEIVDEEEEEGSTDIVAPNNDDEEEEEEEFVSDDELQEILIDEVKNGINLGRISSTVPGVIQLFYYEEDSDPEQDSMSITKSIEDGGDNKIKKLIFPIFGALGSVVGLMGGVFLVSKFMKTRKAKEDHEALEQDDDDDDDYADEHGGVETDPLHAEDVWRRSWRHITEAYDYAVEVVVEKNN